MANRNPSIKLHSDNSTKEIEDVGSQASDETTIATTTGLRSEALADDDLQHTEREDKTASEAGLIFDAVDSYNNDEDSENTLTDLERALPRPRPKRQEVFLPVHGFVWYFKEEMDIIDHPAFQRLGGLHQLGLAHLVYRGATHRRLEHALGTVHAAQCMIDALNNNCTIPSSSSDRDQWKMGCPLTSYEKRFIRLAALLHDIGHVPFGHTFEDELNLLNKHDQQERLDKVFQKTEWCGATVPASLEQLIDRLYHKYMPPGLPDAPADLVKRIILYKPTDPDDKNDQRAKVVPILNKDTQTSEEELAVRGLRIAICGDIVGNTICADLLDYIYRDWYHLGRPRPTVDRIYQYMTIRVPREARKDGYRGFPLPTPKDRFAISLGNASNFRSDGVTAIISLLESRYELAEAVIFHRTKMAATAMLERALSLALPQPDYNNLQASAISFRANLEDWLLDHAEEELLPALIDAREPFDGAATESSELRPACEIASKLLRRDLYDRVLTYTGRNNDVRTTQELYGDSEKAANEVSLGASPEVSKARSRIAPESASRQTR